LTQPVHEHVMSTVVDPPITVTN